MHISPAIPPAKRARAKAKDDIATLASAPRKSRSHKKPAVPAVAAEPNVEVVVMHPGADELTGLIATTAYFIAAERNFAPGQELEDWLEAERRVRSDCAG